jgi:hypothetical protein
MLGRPHASPHFLLCLTILCATCPEGSAQQAKNLPQEFFERTLYDVHPNGFIVVELELL